MLANAQEYRLYFVDDEERVVGESDAIHLSSRSSMTALQARGRAQKTAAKTGETAPVRSPADRQCMPVDLISLAAIFLQQCCSY